MTCGAFRRQQQSECPPTLWSSDTCRIERMRRIRRAWTSFNVGPEAATMASMIRATGQRGDSHSPASRVERDRTACPPFEIEAGRPCLARSGQAISIVSLGSDEQLPRTDRHDAIASDAFRSRFSTLLHCTRSPLTVGRSSASSSEKSLDFAEVDLNDSAITSR